MAGLSPGWKRSGVVTAAGIAALLGSGVFAAPASAHTPKWSVTCSTATVDLTFYNPRVTNTVSVMDDGKDLMGPTVFHRGFHRVLDLPPHDAQQILQLIVTAGDGAQWGVNQTKIAPVCRASAPPSAARSAGPVAPSAPGAGPSARTTAAVPGVRASSPPPGNLAETGAPEAGSALGAAAAVALAAGAGLLFAGRRRRAAYGRRR